MFNQLDSHDTARFKSILGKDVARLPLAVIWLYAWPGVPVFITAMRWGWMATTILSGRKPFPWKQQDQDSDLLALYQRLGKLRKQSRALRQGGLPGYLCGR
ncbi:Neopullulanase 2 [Cedecea neteri]|uniref:Neopullulanase 2 n=1 Tax=Cedecea neteri TaxID=158822 RepID=A0A2X2T4U5_9ENTR|nr:Neopullulanase 2 [Cedecea neteri]